MCMHMHRIRHIYYVSVVCQEGGIDMDKVVQLNEFEKFVDERTIDIGSNIVLKDPEYIRLVNEVDKIHFQIRDMLPDEFKHLIGQYEDICNLMQARAQDIMYEQGLKDGIEFKNRLRLVV